MSFRNYLFSKNVSGGLNLNENKNNLDKIEKYALRIRKEIGDITYELDDKARKFRTTYLEVFDKMFSIYGISSGLIEDKPKEKEKVDDLLDTIKNIYEPELVKKEKQLSQIDINSTIEKLTELQKLHNEFVEKISINYRKLGLKFPLKSKFDW